MPRRWSTRSRRGRESTRAMRRVKLSSALVEWTCTPRPRRRPTSTPSNARRLARYGMPKEIVMRHRRPQFLTCSPRRLFGRVLQLLWSEVMEPTPGPIRGVRRPCSIRTSPPATRRSSCPRAIRQIAARLRRFRGRDPDVAALLKVSGSRPHEDGLSCDRCAGFRCSAVRPWRRTPCAGPASIL